MYSHKINLILVATILLLFIEKSHQKNLVVFGPHSSHTISKRAVSSDIPKIREFNVKTTVANRFAETNVTSIVENVDTFSKQTTFSVALPERAYISGFYMKIEGVIFKAFVVEKEEAEKIYTQSISTGQTAAHVTVSTRKSNRFTINVNVGPESKVSFHLSYEELLQRENGYYEIIANIQPGQIVKKLSVEVEIKESQPLLFVRTPSLRSGNVKVQNNVNLDPQAVVKIMNTSAIVKFSPDINRQLNFACAGLGNNEYDGFAGQFVVLYDVQRDNHASMTMSQDGFFINFFAPPNLPPISKHIVFILDTSGSMYGSKIAQLKDAMLNILPQLYPEDLFSIVQYASTVFVWNSALTKINVLPSNPQYGSLSSQLQSVTIPDALPATKENIEKAKTIINGLEANDATNIIGALEVGLHLVKLIQEKFIDEYNPILIFLTDGYPNEGISDTSKIFSLATDINSKGYKTPIYSLCFGANSDWPFLKNLSLANEGTPTFIDDKEDASSQLQDFFKPISTPALSNVQFKNIPSSAQLTKINFPLYFNGSEIIIAGKGMPTNNTKAITISAKGKKGPMELEAKIGIPLARLERVWAYLTVKQLLEQLYATTSQNTQTELSKLALDIAMNYSLVTDVTSLIVVKPNDTNTYINPVNALQGIIPQPPSQLPMCSNITDWIIASFGTTEPPEPETTTTEMTTTTTVTTTTTTTKTTTTTQPTTTTTTTTTTKPTTTTTKPTTTTTKPTTTTTKPTTTTTKPTTTTTPEPTTTEDSFYGESDVGVEEITEYPTTTTERIKTCNETIYGCCYDGVTEALGPNYLGCDPMPKSDSCSLPPDGGQCNNFTSKWCYDNAKGTCLEFWYSGCKGNDNRFKSKDICEQFCINVNGPEKCSLPIHLGKCAKYTLHWFYDKQKDECMKFMYSGCTGNSNKFTTKQECQKQCVKTKKVNLQESCSLPKDPGTCRIFALKYYYDLGTGSCKKFWYGGCQGNDNRFQTLDECENVCIKPDGKDVCNLPAVKGYCNKKEKKWYFDKSSNTCLRFTYGGCLGNNNRFDKREECYNTCLNDTTTNLQEACFLKRDLGSCTNYSLKWHYDKKKGRCTQFWYGGCDGNKNRFDSEATCKDTCISPTGKDRCKLPKIPGPCKENHERWYYNRHKKQCKRFVYGGCEGNNNNFVSLQECKITCF